MALDLEIQIAILDALGSYYSTDESKAYVDKSFIGSLTFIPTEELEQNLAYLLDKRFLRRHPKRTSASFQSVRITADGIDFLRKYPKTLAKVKHLQKLKERAVRPLMKNIESLVYSQADVFFGGWTKGTVYAGRNPISMLLSGVDTRLYHDLRDHFPAISRYIPAVEVELRRFIANRGRLVESLEKDLNSLFTTEDERKHLIIIAIAGLYGGIYDDAQNKEYNGLVPHFSEATRENFKGVAAFSGISEGMLKEFWGALNSLSFAHKLEGACTLEDLDNRTEETRVGSDYSTFDIEQYYETKATIEAEKFLMLKQGIVDELAIRFQTHFSRPTPQKIRRWLLQFGSPRNIELALKLLQHVSFIDDERMRDIFRGFYEALDSETKEKTAFTIFGPLDESSSQVISKCSKALTEEERKNVWFQPLRDVMKSRDPDDTVLIFVDDNIGSGTQASDVLKEYWGVKEPKEYIKVPFSDAEKEWLTRSRTIYFTLIGMDLGGQRLEDTAKECSLNLSVYSPIKIERQYGCFSPSSLIFDNRSERGAARELAFRIGYELLADKVADKNWSEERRREFALGYGNLQRLIVFSYNTPTSTLPILWKEGFYHEPPSPPELPVINQNQEVPQSRKEKWEPLFPRLP